jgi:predicted amidohydrolase
MLSASEGRSVMSRRKDGPRPAVIGVCSLRQDGAADRDDLLRRNLAMIDRMVGQAAEQGSRLDLAVLPECSFQFVEGNRVEAAAETLDGRIVTAVAEKAKQHRIYATAPTQLLRDGKAYNSVVLLDRRGQVVGVYDKAFPVMMGDGSLEYGITPGREFPVFDLDFGRVGVQICWDIAFDPGWQALADQDAELVLFLTNPAVPTALRGRAWRHGYFIAASTVHPLSMVVSPTGRVLGVISEDGGSLVTRVDLDFRVLHSNCMWEWTKQRAEKYEGRINIEWDSDAHEYLVTSNDPNLPVRRFLETEKLLTGRQRNGRNIRLQDEARGGALVMPTPIERE